MLEWLQKLETQIKEIPILREVLSIVFISLFVFGGTFIILKIAHKSISLSQRKFGDDGKKRAETLFKLVRSISKYITIPTFIILVLPVFGIDPTVVFASAGALGLILGFAFQDFLKDIVGGFFIVFERVYEVEDYITVDNQYTGTVTSITLKATTLEGWTGEIYTINNRDVKNVTNFTKADFAVAVNDILIAKDVPFEKFCEVYEKEVINADLKFRDVLIETPELKGIDHVESNGCVVEFHTKVKALEQYQFRRDFNFFLVSMCVRHGIELPNDKLEVVNDGKNNL